MFWRKQKRLKTSLAVRTLENLGLRPRVSGQKGYLHKSIVFQWSCGNVHQPDECFWLKDFKVASLQLSLFLVLEEKNMFRDSWTLNHRFKVPWEWVWYVQVPLLGSIFQSGCMVFLQKVAFFRRPYEWACWISTTTAPENVSSWGGTECSTWKAITNLEKSQLGDFSVSSPSAHDILSLQADVSNPLFLPSATWVSWLFLFG